MMQLRIWISFGRKLSALAVIAASIAGCHDSDSSTLVLTRTADQSSGSKLTPTVELMPTLMTTPNPALVATAQSGKIAYISNRDGNQEVYIMNADGTQQQRLTYSEDFEETRPMWSPHGRLLAWDASANSGDGHGAIYVLSPESSHPKIIRYL